MQMTGGPDNVICNLKHFFLHEMNEMIMEDNGGFRMYGYVLYEFSTKTFYKTSVFVFSKHTSNY